MRSFFIYDPSFNSRKKFRFNNGTVHPADAQFSFGQNKLNLGTVCCGQFNFDQILQVVVKIKTVSGSLLTLERSHQLEIFVDNGTVFNEIDAQFSPIFGGRTYSNCRGVV